MDVSLGYEVGTGTPVSGDDGYWLSGLADGEGCFYLQTRRRRVGRSGCRSVEFVFKIAMRADDVDTLRQVARILACGRISTFKRSRASGPNAKPMSQFTVQDAASIEDRMIPTFIRFPLRSKKHRDFSLWAQAFTRFRQTLAVTPIDKGLRQRFKRVPEALYLEMQSFDDAIRSVRVFQEVMR